MFCFVKMKRGRVEFWAVFLLFLPNRPMTIHAFFVLFFTVSATFGMLDLLMLSILFVDITGS